MSSLRPGTRYGTFLMVAFGVLLSTLDSSMINVALPAIMTDFDADLKSTDLVVVYLMAITSTLVFWGQLSSRIGKGKVFVFGTLVFGAGSATCSMAGSLQVLVIFRLFQACGAAMMMATGPALIRFAFPKEQLGRALGLIGIATSCGLMCGPVISGIILHHFTWRVLFMVSLPLCLCIVVGALLFILPELKRKEECYSTLFDWSGTFVWIALVCSYVVTFKAIGGFNLLAAAGAGVFVLLTLFFLKLEKSTITPILPLELISRNYFLSATLATALSFCSLFIVIILTPFFLTYISELTPKQIGYTMMAMPASLVICSPVSGWLYDRVGRAALISTIGLACASIGVLLMLTLQQGSSMMSVAACLATLGAGLSIFLSPNSASVLHRVEDRYSGVSSGILATARNFGMMSGAGIAGVGFTLIYGWLSDGSRLGEGQLVEKSFLVSFRLCLLLAVFFLLTSCIVSVLRKE